MADDDEGRVRENPFAGKGPPRARGDDPLDEEIRAKASELAELFLRAKAGRYASLAMTALEQAVLWIAKQIRS